MRSRAQQAGNSTVESFETLFAATFDRRDLWARLSDTTIRKLTSRLTRQVDAKNGKCEPDLMNQAAKKLVDEIDALPDRDRSETRGPNWCAAGSAAPR
jgi:hypothetical protein